MPTHGYPDFETHKSAHDKFAETVRGYYLRFQNGEPLLSQDLLGILVTWMDSHMNQMDKLYSPFLIGKGVK